MVKVKVSSKNQIVIPAEARAKLGIKPGVCLLVDVGRHSLTLVRAVEGPVNAMKGMGKEVWSEVDSDEWLRHERDVWTK